MRKLLLLLSVLLAVAFSAMSFISCSNDVDDVYLEVDKTDISIDNSSETETVIIRTNANWRVVTQNASWISFDKTSGSGDGELVMTISRNSSNKRTGKVIVCAGTEYVEINVTQAASTSGVLTVTTGSCTMTRVKSGSQYKYTVKAQYTIRGGHLASEAGVMFGNSASRTQGTISDGTHTATVTITTSNANYAVTYQAYAVKKSNGAKIYGTSKTKKYN